MRLSSLLAGFLWLMPVALLGSGCVGVDDPLSARLTSCGLFTDGIVVDSRLYAPDDCYRSCLGAASCDDLLASLCRSDLSLLIACDQQCAFRCDDASLIPVEQVCDGADNCDGGEDEDGPGCVPLVCDDGMRVPYARRCDGIFDCFDSSDERGCPGSFDCGDPGRRDGTGRFARACDGREDCLRGGDEDNCGRASYSCPG